MSIRLVDPFLTDYAVTLQEDGEWTGEHVPLLRAARAVPMPPAIDYTLDPILEKAKHVARVLLLEVIEERRPPIPELPPNTIV